MNSGDISPTRDGSRGRVAFVGASWHKDLVDRARVGFDNAIGAVASERPVDHFSVPGAFELPLFVRRLARSGQYEAIVAAALVVDGGIYRHEFVAQAVVQELMTAQIETDIPVFSVVLTPHHFHNVPEHVRFFSEHLEEKGAEAARSCISMLAVMDQALSPSEA